MGDHRETWRKSWERDKRQTGFEWSLQHESTHSPVCLFSSQIPSKTSKFRDFINSDSLYLDSQLVVMEGIRILKLINLQCDEKETWFNLGLEWDNIAKEMHKSKTIDSSSLTAADTWAFVWHYPGSWSSSLPSTFNSFQSLLW